MRQETKGQMKVGDLLIPFEMRISTRARRLTVTLDRGEVKVSVPRGVPREQVDNFLRDKQDWICRHWQWQRQQALQYRKVYETGQEFSYRGLSLTISVEKHVRKTIRVSLQRDKLVINLPGNILGERRPEFVREAVVFWYKNQARRLFREKLDYFAARMGVAYKDFRLKEQKTKWGSCSSLGNINLNWKVIMAPEFVIDYLIIHELAHLRYLNHSQDFWDTVAAHLKDFRQGKKWLKEHGRELEI
jgi:predicted metal-dependent hydrolase